MLKFDLEYWSPTFLQFQLVPLFELLDGGLEVTAHLPPRGLESFTVFGLVGLLGGLPVLEMNLSGKFNELEISTFQKIECLMC